MGPHIRAKNEKEDEQKEMEKEANINFIKIKVPQQSNGYDCGMYALEFSQFAAQFIMETIDKQKQQKQCPSIADLNFTQDKKMKLDAKYMSEARKKWQGIIN